MRNCRDHSFERRPGSSGTGTIRALLRGTRLSLVLGLATGVAACGPDGRQVRLCESIYAEVADAPETRARIAADALPRATPGVALIYRAAAAGTTTVERIECRFRGGLFERGQSELVAVIMPDGHELSPSAMFHLRRRVGLR